MVKVVVCSIPKSGTYLLGALLSNLGMTDAKIHLNVGKFYDYRRLAPETAALQCRSVREMLDDALQRIPDGGFTVSHLPARVAPKLDGFRVIFLHRNLRDVIVSFCRWTESTGRWSGRWSEILSTFTGAAAWRGTPDSPEKLRTFLRRHSSRIKEHIPGCIPWRHVPGVLRVSFEELLGDYGPAVTLESLQRIATVLELEDQREKTLLAALDRAKAAPTVTKSSGRSSRERFWDERVEAEFIRQGFAAANAELGYVEPPQANCRQFPRELPSSSRQVVSLRRAV